MVSWLRDLRYASRVMLKSPAVTLLATLTIAVGIGATTAIFSIVNAVLLSPLPYEGSDRLVMIWAKYPQLRSSIDKLPISAADYVEWRRQNNVFDGVAAVDSATFNLTGSGNPERLDCSRVTDNFFQLMGVGPALGRTFLPEETRPGGENVVVISHGLWQSRFGSNPALVGQTLRLNDKVHTVVGVMPPDFQFPSAADLPSYFEFPPRAQIWTPLVLSERRVADRRSRDLAVIARLKPGVSFEQAQAEMNLISSRLEQQYPENKGWSTTLVGLRGQVVGNVESVLLILVGAVGFVLLIACANVANLLLARSLARQKEISLRMTLGASRARIIRQLLTESLLLALLGGLVGVALAYVGLPLLLALSTTNIPRADNIGIDYSVLGFTFLVAVATGVIFGMAPALQASKLDLNASLKEGTRGTSAGLPRGRVRGILIVSEVALALVLLIGAGLLIRSFIRLLDVAPGFDARGVMTAEIILPPTAYADKRRQAAFFRRVLERLRGLGGVKHVGLVSHLPLKGEAGFDNFVPEGRPLPPPGQEPVVSLRITSPDYFPAMGIPILKGRPLAETDDEKSPLVAVVNENMARTVWPGEDPLGKRVRVGGGEVRHGWEGSWFTVVGVCGDVSALLDAEPKPQLYFSYQQMPFPFMSVAVKTSAEPEGLAAALRNEIWAVDKDQPVTNVKTMEQYISESTAQRRFGVAVLGVFAATALVLASVGLYGVMAYFVVQRRHEIGVRLALGAQSSDILKLVLKQGMTLVAVGVVLGLAAALALTRVLGSLLYEISATDPMTFLLVAWLLIMVALLANVFPALRATKVDPLVALKD